MKKTAIYLFGAAVLAGALLWAHRQRELSARAPVPPPAEPTATALPAPAPADGEIAAPQEDPPAPFEDPAAGLEVLQEADIGSDVVPTPEGIDAMPALSPLAQFSRMVEQLQNNTLISLEEYGRPMLSSTNPTLRALGGVLLSKANALDEAALRQLVADEALAVPFLVMEWIRDYGSAEQIAAFAEALAAREIPADQLADARAEGDFAVGGGRVALDRLMAELPPEDREDAFRQIAEEPELAYDVRMRSLLVLGESAEAESYREALNELRNSAAEEDEIWKEALARLQERIYNDEGTDLLPANQITTRDLYQILYNDYPNMVRDVALYLEDRLLNPDVEIESGSAELVGNFLKEFPESNRDWNVEDEEVLVRLNALQVRLADREHAVEEPTAAPEETPSKPE